MIELIENEEINNPKHRYKLSIDSDVIAAKVRNFSKDNRIFINIKALNLDAAKVISTYKFDDFPNLHFLTMPIRFSESDYYERIYIGKNYLTGQYEINFRYASDLAIWENRKNFLRFYGAYSRFVAELNYSQSTIAKEIGKKNLKPQIKSLSHKNLAYEVSFVVLKFSKNLMDEIQFYSGILDTYHNETLKILQTIDVFQDSDEELNTIISIFNLPEDIKNSCEQYLLSFIQFLRDLGTNATPNLKEEAGKVLFSVTPTNDIEALDKIREALAIYLSLSSNPIPHSTGDRTVDMILSGVRANAKHLESQLELAIAKLQFKEATLELKDATIEQNQLALRQKDETINDLKEMLAKGNIFEETLEKVVINGEVVEESSLYRFSREDAIEVKATSVLDENNEETKIGLVKFHEVTKLKDYGVSFDLAKAIRDLIDYFKRDKNK